jgi:hypothetical protein
MGNILHSWQSQHFSRANIKPCAMSRTNDLKSFQLAITDGAMIVTAYISGGKNTLAGGEENDGLTSISKNKRSPTGISFIGAIW